MHFTHFSSATFAFIATASAFLNSPSSVSPRQSSSCPSVWTDIAADLKTSFVADNGTCTSDARAAIRLSFHDCFPGACDGSIILADECSTRSENAQMVSMCETLGNKTSQYNVSTADIIQFAAGMSNSPPYLRTFD